MMKDKFFGIFVTAFLMLMGLGALVFGKSDILPLEKRYPALPPIWSAESGRTSGETEDYLSDRLPMRDLLTGTDAVRKRVTGMGIDEDILSFGGALNERPLSEDTDQMDRNLDALLRFQEISGLPLTLITPPTAGYVRGRNGTAPLEYHDAELLGRAQASGLKVIPTLDAFSDGELYYRTDPHWNDKGAYKAYTLCCDTLGLQARNADNFTVTAFNVFRGTCYNRSGLWLTKPEDICLWEDGERYTVTMDDVGSAISLFFREHLTGTDPYQVYLDGNHGLTVITREGGTGGTLLMLKDSYGNSLCPLLAGHYARVIMVDLRAFRGRISDLGDVDQVLAVYCLDSLTTSTAFARLKY